MPFSPDDGKAPLPRRPQHGWLFRRNYTAARYKRRNSPGVWPVYFYLNRYLNRDRRYLLTTDQALCYRTRMTRIARTILVGVPYHITQRGNYRQPVFFQEEDYARYLEFICRYARHYALEIWAYCLMPNHTHVVAVPHRETALARTFGLGHMQYTQYVHRRDQRVGHLWQGRFYAAPLDDEYVSAAVRYVERNPVRAGLVETPEAWPWSSAATHLQGLRLPGASYPPDDALATWREYLGAAEVAEDRELIRRRTLTGRPIGDEAFVAALNDRFNQHLTLRPRGRPRKELKDGDGTK